VVVGVGDGDVPDVVGEGDTDGEPVGLPVGDADGHAVAEADANGGRTVGIPVGPRFPDPGVVEEEVELPPDDTYWVDPVGRAVGWQPDPVVPGEAPFFPGLELLARFALPGRAPPEPLPAGEPPPLPPGPLDV
jgi:hypothetical protein